MKPPGCTIPFYISTIGSGNTFGATFWTDGKMIASMMPDKRWLMKSPSEPVLFWTDECKEIGRIEPWEVVSENKEWNDLEDAKEPNQRDYLKALRSDLANTPEKVRYLRVRLWWKGNDQIRAGRQHCLTPAHLKNLSALAELLSVESPGDRLMKAEAFRELGKFAEANLLLDFQFPEDFQVSVEAVRKLIFVQNSTVAKV